MPYEPQKIETKWQRVWRETGAFHVPPQSGKPKYYILDMFPYPSGHGLHVGHLKGYVASDIVARYKRMCGFNVLHPMGWDSFGLPTERQAEREGISPEQVTRRNVTTFKRQLDLVGLSYDWGREFATSDPSFYKWTQWIFLKLFEVGLAYEADVPVNWCPALGTVLANEEVKDGVYIETGDPVERRLMRQWMLKITAYADRLLDDLDLVDWPEEVRELQRNWIGKSEGALIRFGLPDREETFEVFSTRPETLFGGTFCVLAPEHPLVEKITSPDRRAGVMEYVEQTKAKSDRDRLAQADEKTGAFTGAYAINPVNRDLMPVWVADYVLLTYGTGAVFGCPAHDQRDYEFAKKFGLPVIEVVEGGDISSEAFTGEGVMVNSDFLNGLDSKTAKMRMIEHLSAGGSGRPAVTYNLRDWLFSRQRYWGEPIPIIHGPKGELEPEASLPLLLPPSLPEPPPTSGSTPLVPLELARDWMNVTLPSTGEPAKRDPNVMPQWAGSSWYYLRFIDPTNSESPWDRELERAWMPVDLYVGGIEHATLHLLYARFWHKVLYDIGWVSTPEPFKRLFNQGMVHARSFRDRQGRYYYAEQVYEKDGQWFAKDDDQLLNSRIEKMSKSRYNVVPPEPVVESYGADSLRLYEVFMGPLEGSAIWQTDGLSGTRRFLERVWRVFETSVGERAVRDSQETERLLHQTVKKVSNDLEKLQLNTAVSQLMIFINHAAARGGISREALSSFVRLLAPFAPHISEEIWQALGHEELVLNAPWPTYDPEKCVEDEVTIVVQVDGKLRSRVICTVDTDEASAMKVALADSSVSKWIAGKQIAKVVFVPNKLLNIVSE
ncbi:MAG: leucine--tRNA ligase [Acidobacteriota bacterium]|nr:leucine--tRNA ligase [Acidobacteriota bacterium]